METENTYIWEKAKEALGKYELQSLKITDGWKVLWNHFMATDPQKLTEDDFAWINFSEDMATFTCEEYDIDLGWYGGLNKNGYYGVSISRNKTEVETFCSCDIHKITDVINYFFMIPFQTKS